MKNLKTELIPIETNIDTFQQKLKLVGTDNKLEKCGMRGIIYLINGFSQDLFIVLDELITLRDRPLKSWLGEIYRVSKRD